MFITILRHGERAQNSGENSGMFKSLLCYLGAVGSGEITHHWPCFQIFQLSPSRHGNSFPLPCSFEGRCGHARTSANGQCCVSPPSGRSRTWYMHCCLLFSLSNRSRLFLSPWTWRTQTLQNKASSQPAMGMQQGQKQTLVVQSQCNSDFVYYRSETWPTLTETGSFSLENKVWRLNEVACCDTPRQSLARNVS